MTYIKKFGISEIIVSRELWGVFIVVKKEVVAPLLNPQLCTIRFGWQNSEPSLFLGSLYQPTVIQCGGFRHGLLQRHICVLHVTAPDFPLALPQEHGVILSFELYPLAENCGQVSCDNT